MPESANISGIGSTRTHGRPVHRHSSSHGSIWRPPDNVDLCKNLAGSEEDRQLHGDFPLTIDNLVTLKRSGYSIPPRAVTIFKWAITCLMMAGLTVSAVTSKLTLLQLATALQVGNASSFASDQTGMKNETRTIIFVMLVLAVLIPYALTFVRAVLAGGFRPDMPWPSRRALFWCIHSSLLESFGIFLMVLQIFQKMHPTLSALLMSTIYVVQIIWKLGEECRNRTQGNGGHETRRLVLYFIASFFEIAGLAIVFVLVYYKGKLRGDESWQLPLAILCLSLAWSSHAQQKQIEAPSLESQGGYQRLRSSLTGATSINDGTYAYTDNNQTYSNTARWKSSIVTSLLKLIFTGALAFGLAEPLGYFRYSDFSLGNDWASTEYLATFILNVASSVAGYILAYLAYCTCMHKAAFILPLFLVTPIVLVILAVRPICQTFVPILDCLWTEQESADATYLTLFIVSASCLFLGQILCFGIFGFPREFTVLQKESEIFWTPNYNGVMLDQWLLLSRRENGIEPSGQSEDRRERTRSSKVFVCTTMFRETEEEMRSFLETIGRINLAQQEGERYFQSHIFFDGGVRQDKPSNYALRLISLLNETLYVTPEECTKIMTPYGMDLSWKLPTEFPGREMLFSVHLKNNNKVKNKKRWSQVMYMSYILDFLLKEEKSNDHENFILTTDADVLFTPKSVEALLGTLTRDASVGAVCGRTHPLGDGPVVWYQVFDYAITHWLQKTAEHVLGSVLCATGCFSAYRCAAIRSVLPTYATTAEHPIDFLTKDMGDDRWFTTLMVQFGWRVEYCAASENSTHCPEDFEEFYKQRRRWTLSTVANLMLLIKEWKVIQACNHGVPLLFTVYQAILLLSTFIGPATVILIISGAAQYAIGIDAIIVAPVQVTACLMFITTCLYASQNIQLQIAKYLTLMFMLVMAVVTTATVYQAVKDISSYKESLHVEGTVDTFVNQTLDILADVPELTSVHVPVSLAVIYLAGIIGVLLICALLHFFEILCILHGVWYLLCLPSGYLVLTIYSICNITDRSWGTREEKGISAQTDVVSWRVWLRRSWKTSLFCWYPEDMPSKESRSIQTQDKSPGDLKEEADMVELYNRQTHGQESGTFAHKSSGTDETEGEKPLPVEEWLQGEMKELYAGKFRENGFDDTTLISGMTEKDLKEVGVSKCEHVQHLLELIRNLPEFDIDVDVPATADVWLTHIGLYSYWAYFQTIGIVTKKDMEVLKSKTVKEIKTDLAIIKIGHLKRILLAIKKLRKPTEAEENIMAIRSALSKLKTYQLKVVNPEENHFWTDLRRKRLQPMSQSAEEETQMRERLALLRNTWLLMLTISNVLWLAIVYAIATQADLKLPDAKPWGFVILVMFGSVLAIQFLSMMVHRFLTLVHFLAAVSYRFGKRYRFNWAFRDEDVWSGPGQARLGTGNIEVPSGSPLRRVSLEASGSGDRDAHGRTGDLSSAPLLRQDDDYRHSDTE